TAVALDCTVTAPVGEELLFMLLEEPPSPLMDWFRAVTRAPYSNRTYIPFLLEKRLQSPVGSSKRSKVECVSVTGSHTGADPKFMLKPLEESIFQRFFFRSKPWRTIRQNNFDRKS